MLPSSQRERRVSRLNRTGKNTTGWARRLTALLVTACLVMAMALPVYAEVDLLPDAPDEVELLEDKQGTASGEDTVPPEQNAATPVPDAATPEPEQSAEPEQPAPSETPEPTAEPTPTPEPAATATATPVPTVTPTATPEPTEQPQKMYAARSVGNVQAVSEQEATDGFTVYFVVPDKMPKNSETVAVLDSDAIRLNVKTGNNSDNEVQWHWHQMEWTGWKTKDGHKIYAVKNCKDIRGEKFLEIQFQLYWNSAWNDKDWKGQITLTELQQTINFYNNKMYDPTKNSDPTKGEWTDDTILTSHTYFAGKTIKFENRSTVDLKNVKADFYIPDKDGSLKPVNNDSTAQDATQGKTINFTIPSEDCSYIQFTWEGGSSKYYNFYGEPVSDNDKESFRYSEANNCFIYTSADNVRWGVESSVRIYFDASLSSYSYDRDTETSKSSMPTKGGRMYCFFKKSNNTYSEVFTMEEEQTTSGRELWYVDVPEGCKKVRFSAWKLEDNKINEDIAEKNDLTAMLDIPENLNEPCFFADSGDPDMYASGNINRNGYWGEKKDVRDAEAGKKKTVVDITSKYSRGSSKGIKYITSTLYDYYTDYELNGNNRDNYATDLNLSTYRIHIPFRQFDQAVSDYYKNYQNADKIMYPIYTGHFQWASDHCFTDVAEGLSLFGWSKREDNESKYKSFMAANNSEIDEHDGSGKYEFAFLGIVGNKLDSNGNLLMRESGGKDGTGLVEPHFNEAFLNGENSKNTKLGQVYKNVEFPFTQKQIFKDEPGVNYWWYDAAKTSLYLRKDKTTGAYYLGNGNGDGSTVNTLFDNSKNKDSQNKDTQNGHGFFPFNETASEDVRRYNYGYGAKLKIPFTLTENGTVLDDNNKEQSIKFYFSGDDDVWVFIDGQLVLDIGGAHGKAAGIIDFDQRGEKKDKVTAYVSKVKYNSVTGQEYANTSNKKTFVYIGNDLNDERYNPTQYNYSNTVDIPDLSTGQHTLTMYYMERGMWESNMAVAFNFPDNNELQVQKEVDLTNVTDDDFKNCFKNQKIFNFTIQNQATHYGKTDAVGPNESGTQSQKVNLNESNIAAATPGNEYDYIFRRETNPWPDSGNENEQVLHWYARFTDTQSAAREKRRGILTLKNPIDIKDERFLTFQVYVDPGDSGGDLSLNNLYLELLDENDVQKGSLGTSGINGATYGSVEVKTGAWVTVKLDLNKMKAQDGFNGKVKTIRVGDNYSRHIYFRNFTFIPKAVPKTMTGFTTDQKEIPDYGSATSGQLQNAINAQYTSTKDNDTQLVDDDGRFVLEDGETVTFSDQFRRGSYISLKEELNRNLYDTTWTVCENGQAVTSMKGDSESVTVTDTNKSLDKQEGSSPNDGRTEKIRPNDDQTGNNYTGTKPKGDTIVFRSYKDPDENSSTLTKLKVKYVNTVKTGGLKIKKQAADGEKDTIKGTYRFKVTFNNVGGEGLEGENPIERYVDIDMSKSGDHTGTITGIPVNTRYTIEEVGEVKSADGRTDGAKLQSVTVPNGQSAHVINNTMVEGMIVKSEDPNNLPITAIFTNTTRTLINIEFDKLWKDANGKDDLSTAKRPGQIYIQLQRRLANSTNDDDWKPVNYGSTDYVTITPDDNNGWKYTFSGLDQYQINADGSQANYEYRIVEGTVKNDQFEQVAPGKTITIKGNTYVVTAKATPNSEKDSTGSSTGNTATANSETNSETGATTTPAKATDGTITGDSGTIVLTNKLQNPKFVLDIIKKDAEKGENDKEGFLKDVEFKLEKLVEPTTEGEPQKVDTAYKFDNTTNTGSITAITDDNGKITNKFTNLKPGTYRLTEIKAHPGYNLLAQPIVIKFTQGGECFIDGQRITDEGKFKPGTNNTYTMTLTVLNRKTPELPHTGADAPSLWLLIGMPLAVAGLLIFTFRYNRKGGRRH